MPKRRYESHEPTHDWEQLRPLLKDTTQVTYEIIRPVILLGWETPKERGATTGMSPRTIYYKANLFAALRYGFIAATRTSPIYSKAG